MKKNQYTTYEYIDPKNQSLTQVFSCPVCGYPTIEHKACYEPCYICDWEDDGYDESGPNNCSIQEAKDNFKKELNTKKLTCVKKSIEILNEFKLETDLVKRGLIYQKYINI